MSVGPGFLGHSTIGLSLCKNKLMLVWMLGLVLGISGVGGHPIHLTLTEVRYVEKERTVQMVHKIFVDDLERQMESDLALKGQSVRLQLNTPKEHAQTDAFLQDYINEHFILKVNGKTQPARLLGKEYEYDAVWIYAEALNVPKPRQMSIQDSFLLALYADQSNLVNLECGTKKGSFRLHRGKNQEQIDL